MDDRESLAMIGKILDDWINGEVGEYRALGRIGRVLTASGAWE